MQLNQLLQVRRIHPRLLLRKERFLGRGLPVDVSGEPRSKSRPERR